MKDTIFKHLSKRYEVNGNAVKLGNDDRPHIWIQHMFSINNDESMNMFFDWCASVTGGIYCLVWSDGEINWKKGRLAHRDDDLPAIIEGNGSKYWYKNGKTHRDGDKPAIIKPNGNKEWYKHGKLHRDLGPAKFSFNGKEEYYLNGYKCTDNQIVHIIENMKKQRKAL